MVSILVHPEVEKNSSDNSETGKIVTVSDLAAKFQGLSSVEMYKWITVFQNQAKNKKKKKKRKKQEK